MRPYQQHLHGSLTNTGSVYSRTSQTLPSDTTLSTCASTVSHSSSRPSLTSSLLGLGGGGASLTVGVANHVGGVANHSGGVVSHAVRNNSPHSLLNGSLQTLGSVHASAIRPQPALSLQTTTPSIDGSSNKAVNSNIGIHVNSSSSVHLPNVHRSLGTLSRVTAHSSTNANSIGRDGSLAGYRLSSLVDQSRLERQLAANSGAGSGGAAASIGVLAEESLEPVSLDESGSQLGPFRAPVSFGGSHRKAAELLRAGLLQENKAKQANAGSDRFPPAGTQGSWQSKRVSASHGRSSRMRYSCGDSTGTAGHDSHNSIGKILAEDRDVGEGTGNTLRGKGDHRSSRSKAMLQKALDRSSSPERTLPPEGTSESIPFEPLRDAVQHFSEKHLEKIRSFMAGVFARLPLPVKCTIEERHSGKKYAKLHFGCQGASVWWA